MTGREQGDTKSLFTLNTNLKSFFVVVRHKGNGRAALFCRGCFVFGCDSAGSGRVCSWAAGVEVCKEEFIWRIPQGPVKRGNAGIGGLRRGSGGG